MPINIYGLFKVVSLHYLYQNIILLMRLISTYNQYCNHNGNTFWSSMLSLFNMKVLIHKV